MGKKALPILLIFHVLRGGFVKVRVTTVNP